MSERLPISSAPKDGTRVRLFHELDAQGSEFFPTTGTFENGNWSLNQGFIITRGGKNLFSIQPTHWSPLDELAPSSVLASVSP